MPRRGAAFILTLVSVLAGCVDMSALRDLQALAGAIGERYREPAGVNLTTGGRLTITFQNSKYAGLPAVSRQEFARDVARFAFAQYAERDSLQSVSVGFRSVKGAVGFTVSKSEVPYSWSAADLRSMTDSVMTDSAMRAAGTR